MAKMVDTTKKTATEDILDDEVPQDADTAASTDEEEDLSLDVDPTALRDEDESEASDASEERALARSSSSRSVVRESAGGITVPAWALGNPITRWLAESYVELLKVTWPQRRDAWNMSMVVVGVSVVMAILLASADFGLGHLLSYFVSLGLGK